MQEQLIVKGRPNLGNFIFVLLGGMVFATVGWNLMPWDIWLGNDGSGIGYAVLPVFMGGAALACFQNLVVDYNTINVYGDRIEVVSIFGKIRRKVLLSEILAYKKERIKNGKSSFEQCRLYTSTSSLEFTGDTCKNHLEVWAAVTDGRANDESKIDDTFYIDRGWVTVFVVAGLFFCAAGFYLFYKNQRPLAKEELMPIYGTFQFSRSANNTEKQQNSETLKLAEYPRMVFTINEDAYASLDTAANLNNLIVAPPITLMVERTLFESAARGIENDKKKKKKYSAYIYDIPVYALKDNDMVYIALENNPHTRVLGNGGRITWVVFGVLFLIIAAIIKSVERRQMA